MKNLIILVVCCFTAVYCGNTPSTETTAKEDPSPSTSGSQDSITCVSGLLQCRDSIAILLETTADTVLRQYRLHDKTGTLLAMHMAVTQPVTNMTELTRAKVCGINTTTNKKASIQHITVTKVEEVIPKTPENIGLPFEFWCVGPNNEWRVEISNYIGFIYFEHNPDKLSWFLPWLPPTVDDAIWTYDIPANPGTHGSLKLVIKKQPYLDKLAQKNYDYSCEIKANGKISKGGAIRGTADVKGPRQ